MNRFFAVISILIMVAIFVFSSHDVDKTYNLSRSVISKTTQLVDVVPNNIKPSFLDNIKNEYVVRKCAHFILYFLLGLFVTGTFMKMKYKAVFVTIPFCLLFAACDEFRQKFVKGRISSIKDVQLDFFGAIVGAVVFLIILCLYTKIKRKRLSF